MKPKRERFDSEEAAEYEYERREWEKNAPEPEPHSPYLPGGKLWPFTHEQLRELDP